MISIRRSVKSDLENKINHFNNTKGFIGRHFRESKSRSLKLRLHETIAKPTFTSGYETFTLK
jgi:hypothetical protein